MEGDRYTDGQKVVSTVLLSSYVEYAASPRSSNYDKCGIATLHTARLAMSNVIEIYSSLLKYMSTSMSRAIIRH